MLWQHHQVMKYFNQRVTINAVANLIKPITAMNFLSHEIWCTTIWIGEADLSCLQEINWYG